MCEIYRNRLGFSGSGSRETSDSELSRTNLRSVPRLRTFLTGRGITIFRKPPAPLVRTYKALPFFITSTTRKRVNHPHFRYPLACASSLYGWPLLGAFLKPLALPVV